MNGTCPKCGAPAKHMPPDGDFRYNAPVFVTRPYINEELLEALKEAKAALSVVKCEPLEQMDTMGKAVDAARRFAKASIIAQVAAERIDAAISTTTQEAQDD